MATRPAAPAVINSSNVIGAAADGVWLADATGSLPDLLVAQSSLAKTGGSNPAYSSAGSMGGQLTGNGTDVAHAAISPTVSAFGWTMGCIGYFSGTPGAVLDTWASFGDAGHDGGGILGGIFVDDGTFGASGKIIGLWRVQNGGTVGQINGPTFSASTVYACALQVDATDGTTGRLVVNGTAYTTFSNFSENSFGSDSFGNFAFLGSKRQTTTLFPSSSNSQVALGWYAAPGSGITSANLVTWTSDPWDILQASGGTTSASIAATESSDTAAIATTVTTGAALAATETSDTAALTAITALGRIAATDSSDTASITAGAGVTSASVAATESSDTAAIATTVTTGAAITATDGADTAGVTGLVALLASIAAQETADMASILGSGGTPDGGAQPTAGDYERTDYSWLPRLPKRAAKVIERAAKKPAKQRAPDALERAIEQAGEEWDERYALLAEELHDRSVDTLRELHKVYAERLAIEQHAMMMERDDEDSIVALLLA